MKNAHIEAIEKKHLKKELPQFGIGDTIKVSTKIIEGSKERIQTMTGTVIARRGSGLSETVTIYRVAYGSAMERVLPLHSPRVTSIECVKKGKTRRSKLFHIRGKFGKKAKIAEDLSKRGTKEKKVETAPEVKEPEAKAEEPMVEAKPEAPKAEAKPEAVAEQKPKVETKPKAEKPKAEEKTEEKPKKAPAKKPAAKKEAGEKKAAPKKKAPAKKPTEKKDEEKKNDKE